jgi:hypothetical protein
MTEADHKIQTRESPETLPGKKTKIHNPTLLNVIRAEAWVEVVVKAAEMALEGGKDEVAVDLVEVENNPAKLSGHGKTNFHDDDNRGQPGI